MGSSPSSLSFRSQRSAGTTQSIVPASEPGALPASETITPEATDAKPLLATTLEPAAPVPLELKELDSRSSQHAKALHEHLCAARRPTVHSGDSYIINLEWRHQLEEDEYFRQGREANFDHSSPMPKSSFSASCSSTATRADSSGSGGHGGAATSAQSAESPQCASGGTCTLAALPSRARSVKLPCKLRSMGRRTSMPHISGAGFFRVQSNRVVGPKGSLDWTPSRKALETLIVDAQAEDVDPADHRNHEQRLQERLEQLSLDMLVMAGDGNCQFRSLSNELFGSQEHHAVVREKAVVYLRSKRDIFEPFLGEDFDDYVDHMQQDGTWGDELTLVRAMRRAACDSYGVVVHVVTSDAANWYLTYAPTGSPPEETSSREIFLTYIAPIHYNAIRRKSTLRSLGTRTLAVMGNSFKRIGSLNIMPGSPREQSPKRGVASPSQVSLAASLGATLSAPQKQETMPLGPKQEGLVQNASGLTIGQSG